MKHTSVFVNLQTDLSATRTAAKRALMEEAERDYSFALDLAILAEKADNMYIYLHRDIPCGNWKIKDLLIMLALQLDPLSCELPKL